MSTRAVIARAEGDTWAGRYQHSDGYPTYLGRNLWRVWHEYPSTKAFLHDVIDEHPTGWSIYNGPKDCRCYCHPQRAVGPYAEGWHNRRPEIADFLICAEDDTDTEWSYVISETGETFTIFERAWGDDGEPAWKWRGTFPKSGPEPTWSALEV